VKIDFVRVGDRYFTEVERDDGALVRLRGPAAGAVPHDLVHYVVEDELGFDRGFWGKVGRGENVGKVEYLRAPSRKAKPLRRPPTGKGGDIEAIVGLVTRISEQPRRDGESIREALRTSLAAAIRDRARLEPAAVERMCRRLDAVRSSWEKLPNGGRISFEFPSKGRGV
jgi:hypothetical protein